MASGSIAEADRDYSPGDIIVQCPMPLVHVTKYEHRLFTCDQCVRKVNSATVCPACRKVYYCGRQCQDQHWEGIHKLECPILARHKPLQFETNGIDYMQRLTLRLYLLMSTNVDIRTKEFFLHNGLTRQLDQMKSHANELKDSPQFQGILNYFKLYKIDTFDYDTLLRAYGILHVNSFGIDRYDCSESNDVQIEHCGTGLYVEASIFDHSCVPNAAASGEGLALEIRALSHIRKGDQIFIDYLQDVMPREERQNTLAARYFFTCGCSQGCSPTNGKPFDSSLDYKRYSVLSRVIDSLLENAPADNDDGSSSSKQNEINWSQLYRCWKQRLRLQEQYYAACQFHPCLSLFYREFLRFLLVNQHRFNASIKQNNQAGSNNSTALTAQEIEQDLLEFGSKVKQHLAITHGLNHSFYSRLFADSAADNTNQAQ